VLHPTGTSQSGRELKSKKMTLDIFIIIAGLLGAIIILRINQWTRYRETSHCETASSSGLIWLYSAVIIGIAAIILALLQTASSDSELVEGVPLGLFVLMVFMALVEIISVLFSVITKAFSGRHTNKSWLSFLDETRTQDEQSYTVVSLFGKFFIGLELLAIIIFVIFAILISLWCK
jgi:hypothetical protein